MQEYKQQLSLIYPSTEYDIHVDEQLAGLVDTCHTELRSAFDDPDDVIRGENEAFHCDL